MTCHSPLLEVAMTFPQHGKELVLGTMRKEKLHDWQLGRRSSQCRCQLSLNLAERGGDANLLVGSAVLCDSDVEARVHSKSCFAALCRFGSSTMEMTE